MILEHKTRTLEGNIIDHVEKLALPGQVVRKCVKNNSVAFNNGLVLARVAAPRCISVGHGATSKSDPLNTFV